MRKITAMVLAALMVLSLAACGEKTDTAAADNSDRAVNLSTLAALTTFDDCQTNNIQDEFVLYQTNDYLYWLNGKTLEVEPRVSDSWTWSEDGTELTLHVRKGVKFHNGKEVTADDVLFSLQRSAEDSHHAAKWTDCRFEKIDDENVKIILPAPNAGFLVSTAYHCAVVNKEEVEAAGEKFGTEPHTAGCGPYKWGKVESMDSYWEIEAFDDYYLGAPSIKKATYKPMAQAASGLIAFEAGELDWYIAPMANWDELTANEKYNTELVAANHQSYLTINYTNGELKDENLRKAIAYAINKEECNDVAYSGMAKIANFMYDPDNNVGAPDNGVTYNYDTEKAKEYLAKSSMPNGGKLSGALQCSAGGYFEKIATVVQQNLSAIGLEIEVTPYQSATNMEMMRENNYFMGISGGSPVGDYSGINSWFLSATSYGHLIGEKADPSVFDEATMWELYNAGGQLGLTNEQRKEAYQKFNDYVMERAVYIPIFHKVQPYVWTKDLNVPYNYQDYYQLREWSWN